MTTLPSDYEKDDGWNDQQGVEQCPHCDKIYSPNGGYTGKIYDQNGREYEHLLATEPGKGPYFCKDCWPILEAHRKANNNQSLTDFE